LSGVAWQLLRQPFAPAEVRFKVQRVLGENKGATIVSYIDARSVIERLEAAAPADWQDSYLEVQGGVLCRLTLGQVARCDVGWAADRSTDAGFKGCYSDAFKRAAVKFGVGLFLYAMDTPKLWVGDGPAKLRTDKKGRPMLDEDTLGYLRKGYEGWLARDGIRRFGVPAAHFDVPFEAAA